MGTVQVPFWLQIAAIIVAPILAVLGVACGAWLKDRGDKKSELRKVRRDCYHRFLVAVHVVWLDGTSATIEMLDEYDAVKAALTEAAKPLQEYDSLNDAEEKARFLDANPGVMKDAKRAIEQVQQENLKGKSAMLRHSSEASLRELSVLQLEVELIASPRVVDAITDVIRQAQKLPKSANGRNRADVLRARDELWASMGRFRDAALIELDLPRKDRVRHVDAPLG